MNISKIKLPHHLAIIMDGNGRWATKRKLPRLVGHKEGVEAIKRTIKNIQEITEIKILTFFAFSTENWNRSKEEINGIFQIIRDYIDECIEKVKDENIKITTMGDITKLPNDLAEKIEKIVNITKEKTGLVVNLAVNYGARDEVVRAFNILKQKNLQTITFKDIQENLYSKDFPDPDLIIRTSGEMRLSNFMLIQSAYSELYFTKTYWPSFDKKDLYIALKDYSKRERRFGKITN